MLVTVAVLGAIAIGLAIEKAESSPSTLRQPIIVASLHTRGITQSIRTTTIFTPAVRGVFRVSFYTAMTTPGTANTAGVSS